MKFQLRPNCPIVVLRACDVHAFGQGLRRRMVFRRAYAVGVVDQPRSHAADVAYRDAPLCARYYSRSAAACSPQNLLAATDTHVAVSGQPVPQSRRRAIDRLRQRPSCPAFTQDDALRFAASIWSTGLRRCSACASNASLLRHVSNACASDFTNIAPRTRGDTEKVARMMAGSMTCAGSRNTVIVSTSDHGEAFGRPGARARSSVYEEESARLWSTAGQIAPRTIARAVSSARDADAADYTRASLGSASLQGLASECRRRWIQTESVCCRSSVSRGYPGSPSLSAHAIVDFHGTESSSSRPVNAPRELYGWMTIRRKQHIAASYAPRVRQLEAALDACLRDQFSARHAS